ncbi:hypothetical protein ACCO45_002924 [Purpureocillium lilacinum]|uniref:Uncharacterized protein n=1 Tax=Purpureocillium lilacinum TaxID=33203 RepID=A0ACC4DYR7_PURLI
MSHPQICATRVAKMQRQPADGGFKIATKDAGAPDHVMANGLRRRVAMSVGEQQTLSISMTSHNLEMPTILQILAVGSRHPQDVSVEDVAYVGAKLREWGRGADGGRFLTMPAENTPDCAEWSIFTYQSVLALAKHIDPNVHTSVLYEDIARTVDGGESASDEDKAKAIIGCEKSGGSLGVLVNETDPAYHTEDYKRAGYTPQGIIIKIVSNVPKEEL